MNVELSAEAFLFIYLFGVLKIGIHSVHHTTGVVPAQVSFFLRHLLRLKQSGIVNIVPLVTLFNDGYCGYGFEDLVHTQYTPFNASFTRPCL